MSSVKRTKHAVYDTKYHLVWIPKYRKNIFDRKILEYIKEVFQEIAEQFEFEIDTMEVMKDHVRLFLSAPPRYSPVSNHIYYCRKLSLQLTVGFLLAFLV